MLEELSHTQSRVVADVNIASNDEKLLVQTTKLLLRACELRDHLLRASKLLQRQRNRSLLGSLTVPTRFADVDLEWSPLLFAIAGDTDITCQEVKEIISVLIDLLDRLVNKWLDDRKTQVHQPGASFRDRDAPIAPDWNAANRNSAQNLIRLLLWSRTQEPGASFDGKAIDKGTAMAVEAAAVTPDRDEAQTMKRRRLE